jgi:arginine deiminase
MTLIPVPVDDQLKYGVNFLTVSANEIIAVDGVSQGYKDQLKQAGVDATWIDFRNMTGGYGAAHCVTQVLRRDPVPVLGSANP